MARKITTAEVYALFPDLEPGQEYVHSKTKMRFKCDKVKEHRFLMRIHERKKYGCSICAGNVKLTTAEIYAQLPDLEPGQEYVNGETKMWFICPQKHRFLMKVRGRKEGYGCPKCKGNKKLTTAEVYALFPDLEPGQEYVHSKTKMRFKCPEGHLFIMRISNRIGGQGCPYYPCNTKGKIHVPPFPHVPGVDKVLKALKRKPVTPVLLSGNIIFSPAHYRS